MIYHFLRNAFGFCPARFGVPFCSVVFGCWHFVDLWKYFVCCFRSGVTRCTLLTVLYLDRMCRCGLHAMLRLQVGILMHRFAVHQDFYSVSVSLWNDLADLVFDGVRLADFKSRANVILLAELLYPYYSLLPFFSFSSLFICWSCGAGVFG